MNTAVHAIVNLTAIRKSFTDRKVALAVFWGAVFPDLSMLVFYPLMKVQGYNDVFIWQNLYHSDLWQWTFRLSNSIPIAMFVAFTAWYLRKDILYYFCTSAVMHLIVDLLTHNKDAHEHFFPFTYYKFYSPISYWDTGHYATYLIAIELFVVGTATYAAFRKMQSYWERSLWYTMMVFYAYSLYQYYAWTYIPRFH